MKNEPSNISIRNINLCLYEKVKTFKTEEEVLDFIDQIKPGETLFDLGACGGAFSLYAASKGIRVWAFEPNSMNFQLLLDNVGRNKNCRDRIIPLHYAAGSHLYQEEMLIDSPYPGSHNKVLKSSSRKDLNVKGRSLERVNVIAIDSLGVVPDYMKIDVDGSELNCVKGALKTLSNPKLKKIIIELNVSDNSYKQINKMLLDCGLVEKNRFKIEKDLHNIVYGRKNG